MENIKNNPIISSILSLVVVFLINRLPLNDIFRFYGFDKFYAENIENIILYTLIAASTFWMLKKFQIPFSLNSSEYSNTLYYCPLLIYIFIFTSGFNDFSAISFSSVEPLKLGVYSIETFASAFLEEILFRGLILGLLINKYINLKGGIIKSVVTSGVLFGLMHIINIWTMADKMSIEGVIYQIYAAACLGVMYGAVYLKTRSILILSILHFTSNFFAGIEELGPIKNTTNSFTEEEGLIEMILSGIATLVIFGFPLLIGLFILQRTKQEEVENLFWSRRGKKKLGHFLQKAI